MANTFRNEPEGTPEHGTAAQDRHHVKEHRKHKKRLINPCAQPPAVPANVAFRVRAREAREHLKFYGRVICDEVELSSDGFKTIVDLYEAQWIACDVTGEPVSRDDLDDAENEVQTVELTDSPTNGTFKLKYNDSRTTALNYNASAAAVEAALEALKPLKDTTLNVNRNGSMPYIWTITFGGALRGRDVPQITGVNVDLEVGKTTITTATTTQGIGGQIWFKQRRKAPAPRLPIRSAEITVSTIARFITRENHGYNAGDRVTVTGVTPAAYNGTWTILTIVGANTFEVDIAATPIDATEFGLVKDANDVIQIMTGRLVNERTVYWKARMRARDNEKRWSEWSPWTTPLLPFSGARPMPPTPTYGATPITFDNKGKGKYGKTRLKFTFNEVENFDYPGTPADDEDDVDSYIVQINRSDDGVVWDSAPYRTRVWDAKHEDPDTTRTVIFHSWIRRRYWYQCRVRSKDRFNRKSEWSEWTDAAQPFDDDRPPPPENVKIYASATDRVVVDWVDPLINIGTRGTTGGTNGTSTISGTNTKFETEVEAGTRIRVNGQNYRVKKTTSDTALTIIGTITGGTFSGEKLYLREEDPDVAYYVVQIAKLADVDLTPSPNEWNDVFAEDRVDASRKSFKVSDNAATYYARVRSVDAAKNKSRFIPATTGVNGNSDYLADGDGVQIGSGSGAKIVATFTKPGDLRVRHYPNKWVNLTGGTLTFAKARATVGDVEAGTGAPTGAPVRLNIRRWPDPEVNSHAPIWTSDDTLKINAGTYLDLNGPSSFDITTLLDGEAITVKVIEVGSTVPGRDLEVQLYMTQ